MAVSRSYSGRIVAIAILPISRFAVMSLLHCIIAMILIHFYARFNVPLFSCTTRQLFRCHFFAVISKLFHYCFTTVSPQSHYYRYWSWPLHGSAIQRRLVGCWKWGKTSGGDVDTHFSSQECWLEGSEILTRWLLSLISGGLIVRTWTLNLERAKWAHTIRIIIFCDSISSNSQLRVRLGEFSLSGTLWQITSTTSAFTVVFLLSVSPSEQWTFYWYYNVHTNSFLIFKQFAY